MYKKHMLKTMLTHLTNEMERAEHYYYCGFGHIYSALFDVVVMELAFMEKQELISESRHNALLLGLLTGDVSAFKLVADTILSEECGGADNE